MKEVLELLQKFINYYNSEIFDSGKGFRLNISSKEMYDTLCSLKINEKDIIIDRIVNSNYLHHFLRGLIDAKSTFSDGRLYIPTSKENDEQFRQLLKDKIGLEIISKNKLALRKHNIIKLREYLYQDAAIYIKEKYNKLFSV